MKIAWYMKGSQVKYWACSNFCCKSSQAIQTSNRKSIASKLLATSVQGFTLYAVDLLRPILKFLFTIILSFTGCVHQCARVTRSGPLRARSARHHRALCRRPSPQRGLPCACGLHALPDALPVWGQAQLLPSLHPPPGGGAVLGGRCHDGLLLFVS